jgi:hypothetical protein
MRVPKISGRLAHPLMQREVAEFPDFVAEHLPHLERLHHVELPSKPSYLHSATELSPFIEQHSTDEVARFEAPWSPI